MRLHVASAASRFGKPVYVQVRGLILASAMAVAAIAASVSIYARIAASTQKAVTPRIESSVAVDPGRVLLTPPQIAETRDRAVWPAEMHSLLRIDHKLGYGEWLWNDRGVPAGKATIRVDLGRQIISVARGGHEVGTAVILYGAPSHATPLGRHPILGKNADYHSRAYDAPMPYALRLTDDGVAIHGSNVRLGRATHGCIGLPLEFAKKLFAQVNRGDVVLIVRT